MSLSVVKMGNSFFIFFGIKTTLAKVIKKSIEKANKVGFMRLKAVFIDNLRVSKLQFYSLKTRNLSFSLKI